MRLSEIPSTHQAAAIELIGKLFGGEFPELEMRIVLMNQVKSTDNSLIVNGNTSIVRKRAGNPPPSYPRPDIQPSPQPPPAGTTEPVSSSRITGELVFVSNGEEYDQAAALEYSAAYLCQGYHLFLEQTGHASLGPGIFYYQIWIGRG